MRNTRVWKVYYLEKIKFYGVWWTRNFCVIDAKPSAVEREVFFIFLYLNFWIDREWVKCESMSTKLEWMSMKPQLREHSDMKSKSKLNFRCKCVYIKCREDRWLNVEWGAYREIMKRMEKWEREKNMWNINSQQLPLSFQTLFIFSFCFCF